MDSLSSPITIGTHTLKNRIVCAPLGILRYPPIDNCMTRELADFYIARAKGGAAMVIAGSACVTERKDGLFYGIMPGLWCDEQIEGFSYFSEGCHKYDSLALAQLHSEGRVDEFTTNELRALGDAYIEAAIRSKKAGLDGVEIHCAHGWLLSCLLDPITNNRIDCYGGSLENRLTLLKEIVQGIKESCGNDFMIDCRVAGSAPDLDGAIRIANKLDEYGVDLLHVSFGASPFTVIPPADYPCGFVTYSGACIKQYVSIPVMSVSGISTPEKASYLIENGYSDLVAIGRSMLVNENWAREAISTPDQCKSCIECNEPHNCDWMIAEGYNCPQQ